MGGLYLPERHCGGDVAHLPWTTGRLYIIPRAGAPGQDGRQPGRDE
jgi:hypothetical protein